MAKKRAEYRAEDIKNLEGLAYVRETIERQLGSVGRGKAAHKRLVREITDNSFDELKAEGEGTVIGIFHYEKKLKTYSFMIIDSAAGVPIQNDTLKRVFTKIGTSGKFRNFKNDKVYRRTAGEQGAGSKATAGCAEYFRAISYRADGIGDLLIHRGEILHHKVDYKTIKEGRVNGLAGPTGLFVYFEPDKTILEDTESIGKNSEIMDEIIDLFSKIGIFNRNFDLRIYESLVSLRDVVINGDYETLSNSIMDCFKNRDFRLEFNSKTMNSTQKIMKNLFGLKKPVWADEEIHRDEEDISFDVSIVLDINPEKTRASKSSLTLVNNVELTDYQSSPQKAVQDALKEMLSDFILDKSLKKWFLKSYLIPVYMLINVSYDNVGFTGASKASFHDKKFEKVFSSRLVEIFKTYEKNAFKRLFIGIEEHLKNAYAYSIKKPNSSTTTKSLLFTLNRPKKFKGCIGREKNRELFLVEGDSAIGIAENRDVKRQAFYSLRGKVQNIVRKVNGPKDKIGALTALNKSPILQDIMTILGVTPNDENLDNLNYDIVTTCQDADPDGFHIAITLISDFFLINPKLITEKRVRIALPPLYAISKGKERIFVKDFKSFLMLKSRFFYKETLEIFLQTKHDKRPKLLNEFAFEGACQWLYSAGKRIETTAKSLGIDPYIFEALLYVTVYLTDAYLSQSVDVIEDIFGKGKVVYQKDTKSLVIVSDIDHVVPIAGLANEIRKNVFPILMRYRWYDFSFFIRRKDKKEKDLVPVNIYDMYKIFKSIDASFKVKRFKGLGELSSEESAVTCLHPLTRSFISISSVGDVEELFSMMENDTTGRKRLLSSLDISN